MITYEKHRSSSLDYIYRQYDTNLNFPSHFHDSFEFIYVYEGEITIIIDKDTFVLTKGQGLLILPNQIHSYVSNSYSRTFILIFAASYVMKYYKTSLSYHSLTPYFSLEGKQDIIKNLEKGNDTFLLKSCLYYIVYLYNHGEMVPRNEKYNFLMQKILTYIEENYAKDISLKIMAKELGYDYHYLSGIINEGLNTNFLSFVNEYRINKVCELMMDDQSSSLSSLALSCGYTSMRTFNRNFMEIYKITPSEYRQKLYESK